MTKRPNWANKEDACCACGVLLKTPGDHEAPGSGELAVWQPSPSDPPQWICPPCKARLEADERRAG
jgi:hypothetical protein